MPPSDELFNGPNIPIISLDFSTKYTIFEFGFAKPNVAVSFLLRCRKAA
jgi:hypothetical protein